MLSPKTPAWHQNRLRYLAPDHEGPIVWLTLSRLRVGVSPGTLVRLYSGTWREASELEPGSKLRWTGPRPLPAPDRTLECAAAFLAGASLRGPDVREKAPDLARALFGCAPEPLMDPLDPSLYAAWRAGIVIGVGQKLRAGLTQATLSCGWNTPEHHLATCLGFSIKHDKTRPTPRLELSSLSGLAGGINQPNAKPVRVHHIERTEGPLASYPVQNLDLPGIQTKDPSCPRSSD